MSKRYTVFYGQVVEGQVVREGARTGDMSESELQREQGHWPVKTWLQRRLSLVLARKGYELANGE